MIDWLWFKCLTNSNERSPHTADDDNHSWITRSSNGTRLGSRTAACSYLS